MQRKKKEEKSTTASSVVNFALASREEVMRAAPLGCESCWVFRSQDDLIHWWSLVNPWGNWKWESSAAPLHSRASRSKQKCALKTTRAGGCWFKAAGFCQNFIAELL